MELWSCHADCCRMFNREKSYGCMWWYINVPRESYGIIFVVKVENVTRSTKGKVEALMLPALHKSNEKVI